MTWTATLNTIAESWAAWLAVGLLDATIVVLLVAFVWGLMRRRASAALGCWLFLLVFLKVCIPFEIPVPRAVAVASPRHWADVFLANYVDHDAVDASGPVVNESGDVSEVVSEPIIVDPAGQYGSEYKTGSVQINSSVPIYTGEQKGSDVGDATDVPFARGSNDLTSTGIIPTPFPAPVEDAQEFGAVAAPGPATEPNEALSWLAWLMIAWTMSVAFLLTRLVLIQARFARTVRGARPIGEKRLPLNFEALCRQAGLRCKVRLVENTGVTTPAVWGFRRCFVLLPEGMVQRMTPEQLRYVLLHELAHIRRMDVPAAVFQRVVTIVHFMNPAIWVAGLMVNRLREYACDDMALSTENLSRKASGEAFLHVVEHAATVNLPMGEALGVFDFKTSLKMRLVRMLDKGRAIRTRLGIGSVVVLVLAAVLVLPRVKAGGTRTNIESPDNDPVVIDDVPVDGALSSDDSQQLALLSADELQARVLRQQQALVAIRRWVDTSTTRFEVGYAPMPLSEMQQIELRQRGVNLSVMRDVEMLRLEGGKPVDGYGHRVPLPDEFFDVLHVFPRLERLYLSNTLLDDGGAVRLAGLGSLRRLSLRHTSVTDRGVANLLPLTDLTALNLQQTAVTPRSFATLVTLHHLEELQMPFAGDDLDCTQLPYALYRPDYYYGRLLLDDDLLQDDDLAFLPRFVRVEELWLDAPKLTDEALDHVARMPALKTLYIRRYDNFTPDCYARLADSSIRNMFMVPLDVLPSVSAIRSLEYLEIHDRRFDGSQLEYVGDMPNLRMLDLSRLSKQYRIQASNDVDRLVSYRHPWRGEGLEYLSDLPRLQTLFLDNTSVDNETLAQMVELLPGLKRLSLEHTLVDSQGLASLDPLRLDELLVDGTVDSTAYLLRNPQCYVPLPSDEGYPDLQPTAIQESWRERVMLMLPKSKITPVVPGRLDLRDVTGSMLYLYLGDSAGRIGANSLNMPDAVGLLLDDEGYVLTTAREGRGQVSIAAAASGGGRRFPVELVGVDETIGIAVLKFSANDHAIDSLPEDLVAAADSEQDVLELVCQGSGPPFAFSGVILSEGNSVIDDTGQMRTGLLRANSWTPSACCGAPLVNISGDVVAISLGIDQPARRATYAVPMEDAVKAARRMIRSQ